MNTDPSSTGRIKHNWLAAMLLRQSEAVQARFARIYLQLRQQPRNVRRKLMRRYGTSLAGLALVVTLGGGTLYPAAHAQSQQRQGRRGAERVELANGSHNVPVGALSRGVAATITVDGTTCTLADALVSANTNAAVGGCIAGTGDDVIDIQADVILSTDLSAVSSNITVEGNDHLVDGKSQYTAFKVATTSGDLTLNDIAVANTYSSTGGGPAVYAYQATLSIHNSEFSGNVSSGYEGGTIKTVDTMVTISNTVFRDNHTIDTPDDIGIGGAGALFLGTSVAQVENSLFTDNSVFESPGSAILSADSAEVTIANSTFVGNSAGYGTISNNGTSNIQIINSTITGNNANYGAGVSNNAGGGGVITISHSIISGNAAGVANEVEAYYGPIYSDGYNVLGESGESNDIAFYNFTPDASDIVVTSDGTLPTPLDGILATDSGEPLLADNGGPTHTVALVTDSPAIDIAPTGPTHDQRGHERPVVINDSEQPFDAGAYEFAVQQPPSFDLFLPLLQTEPDAPQLNAEQSLLARLFSGIVTL